jgi:branched-chain amino acid transport system substrate-binding protein
MNMNQDILREPVCALWQGVRFPLLFLRLSLAACVSMASASAVSQDGVSRATILLGQSGDSSQGAGRENVDGANAYFAFVNRQGGVFGRKIELKSYDDGRDTKRVIENTERLITQDKVFALMGYRATPSIEAVMPLLAREKLPMVAPFSGSKSLRVPHNPMIFHMRASYHQEAVALIQQLTTQRVRRIALLAQDDSFGKNGMEGFEDALAKAGVKPVAVSMFPRKTSDVRASVAIIAAANPDAVAMACGPKGCADFIKQIRALGLRPQFLTISNLNSDEFANDLGEDGRGLVMTQVMPHPWSSTVPLAREFRQVLKEVAPTVPISYSSFEGFVAAKLIVSALRAAGPDVTRAKFIGALESMKDVDLGGFRVRFSPSDHQGSNYVDITLISRDRKFIR